MNRLVFLAGALAAFGPWGLFPADAQRRGDIVSAEIVVNLTGEEVGLAILDVAEGIPETLIRLFVPTPYDIVGVRIVYHTVDGRGRPTIASGLAVVPVNAALPAPLVAYHHGTVAHDAGVPSSLSTEALMGYALAADGYVAALPDYLGLGASPIAHHPYVHAETEAGAAIDMMRATRRAMAVGGVPLNGQVFLTGYSQGGHAVVATLRAIQRDAPAEFDVQLTTAGSGPYSLSWIQFRFIMDNPLYPTRGYLPFLLFGYQPIYGNLYASLDEVLLPPWDADLLPLFDRTNTLNRIERTIPETWMDIFEPDYLGAIVDSPDHPVRSALRDNDVLDFTPQSPLWLMFCTGDEQVDFRNAVAAWFVYDALREAQVPVVPIPIGALGHRECAPYVLVLSKLAFDALRTF